MFLCALAWHDNSEPEARRNAEAQNAVDVGFDHLEVHESDEELLMGVSGSCMQLSPTVIQCTSQALELFLIFLELIRVVNEFARVISSTTNSFANILCLCLVDYDAEDLVVVFVDQIGKRHYRAWNDHTGAARFLAVDHVIHQLSFAQQLRDCFEMFALHALFLEIPGVLILYTL